MRSMCSSKHLTVLDMRVLLSAAHRDSLAIFAFFYERQQPSQHAGDSSLNSKRQPCWDARKKNSRRVHKIWKLSAAAGSAYAHFFLGFSRLLSSRNPSDDELSLACAKKPGMIDGFCFLDKAYFHRFHNGGDAALEFKNLLGGAEAGNAVAQLVIADMCASPFDATLMHCSPSHYDVRCCADTTSGE
jgi:hypothetical protein